MGLTGNPFGNAEPAFAIVCALPSEHDTRQAPEIGGQAPALKGLFVTFNLCAVIKEMGFQAARSAADRDRFAALPALAHRDPSGTLPEVIFTDLPLAADQREVPG